MPAATPAAVEPPAPSAPAAPPPAHVPVPVPAYAAPPPASAPASTGWPKAPLFARLLAAIIDSIIMQPLVVPAVFWILADSARQQVPVGGLALITVGGLWMFVYAYIKDGLKGASLGKRIVGLMVVNLKDDRPAGIGASILRALVLNLISPIEAIMVLVDSRGQRLGDKAAKTQVIRMADYAAAVPGCVRPGKGLAIALLVATLLLGSVGGVVGGLLWANAMTGADASTTETPAAPVERPSAAATAPAATDAQVQVDVAVNVVTGFYTAINEADMAGIKAAVDAELQPQMQPGAFEGWNATTFEFTRGWIDGGEAHIVGRESAQAYGSGSGGGVEFDLTDSTGAWLITGWHAVDATQVEGSDTAGSSTGLPGPLSDAKARDLVTQVLQARQTGAANTIRRLSTEGFLADNGEVWLTGMDETQYFTKFKITSVKASGSVATVTVSETWVDGAQSSTYGLVVTNGAVLLDSWSVK
jgi:uncharacterized RDD family membrane protein YckC